MQNYRMAISDMADATINGPPGKRSTYQTGHTKRSNPPIGGSDSNIEDSYPPQNNGLKVRVFASANFISRLYEHEFFYR